MKIRIETAPAYDVYIENDILQRVGSIVASVREPGTKVLIVSDTHVFPLYGAIVDRELKESGFKTYRFIFDAGEPSKKIQTVYKIYEMMAENNFTRKDIILTLGGGVAGDMGGFAAATFLRGIGFVQVPTSLLAQVDSSVGGKTGVDLPFGKNLVGAFHQPLVVIADPKTLSTLPKYYFNDGMGEVIKYGCISDKNLFAKLKKGIDISDMTSVIARCIELKKEVVEEDTKDIGRRMILNFGHTFGHGIEKLNNFEGIAHGEAVGIGMVIAAQIGEKLGVTASGTTEEIIGILKQYSLPTECSFSKEDLIHSTMLDKKSLGDSLNLILIDQIGESNIYQTTREELSKIM
ncbi:3-dehydroquinate synthase [Scatolibacter rhodanostii]|uniref:3-dehydroquinate synthase n=1 Tax=Scatolibacter rhodanostii TaxID=2014781 RepID=UPI000C077694|nr:3-dehydroquinate synthase [Scatolibacter rhodanostii]